MIHGNLSDCLQHPNLHKRPFWYLQCSYVNKHSLRRKEEAIARLMKKYSGVELIYGRYKWYKDNKKDTFDIISISDRMNYFSIEGSESRSNRRN